MTKIFAICVLSIMGVIFVSGIVGYFIFLSRVKTKKTAIMLKRKLKKAHPDGLAAGQYGCWHASLNGMAHDR